MALMKITKRFEISYSHTLPNHPGKCSNLHGHNAIVDITLAVNEGNFITNNQDRNGMVMDFGEIKNYLEDNIKKEFDHTNLNDKMFFKSNPPTAENLCFVLLRRLSNILHSLGLSHIQVASVTIWEDRDSCATLENDLRDLK